MVVPPEKAPAESEVVEVGFEGGNPVSVNGRKLPGHELIAELNKIGGRHAVGIALLVENRLVGMKSRGVYETPGGTILYEAHKALEQLCVERDTLHYKQQVALRYAELVYNGQWFHPLREALQAFVDHTNAAVTGLLAPDASAWSDRVLDALAIPAALLPTLVDSAGVVGEAAALPGAPPIAALVGDQQGSLVGQGCVTPGRAKVTFGTGGMLDLCRGPDAPTSAQRAEHGTYPIVAWSQAGTLTWGVEAIMLSAGTNVEWLCDDLGLVESPAHTHDVASSVETAEGVIYVPALLGLGTPAWDYGARGTLLGITRGTTAAHVVRAVLEGVAHRGADLVEAAEADTGLSIETLRVDGGMSANATFVQALADSSGRPVQISPVSDATTLGAAFLAGLATGVWGDIAEADNTWRPARVVTPGSALDRKAWARAVERAAGWIPELSALDF
jgi:glycerol kinase